MVVSNLTDISGPETKKIHQVFFEESRIFRSKYLKLKKGLKNLIARSLKVGFSD